MLSGAYARQLARPGSISCEISLPPLPFTPDPRQAPAAHGVRLGGHPALPCGNPCGASATGGQPPFGLSLGASTSSRARTAPDVAAKRSCPPLWGRDAGALPPTRFLAPRSLALPAWGLKSRGSPHQGAALNPGLSPPTDSVPLVRCATGLRAGFGRLPRIGVVRGEGA